MCDFRDGFKLCSCKKNELTNEDFIWELRLRNSIKFLQGKKKEIKEIEGEKIKQEVLN